MPFQYVLANLLADNPDAEAALFLDDAGETVDFACAEQSPYEMRLLGVLNMRDLMLSPPDKPLESIMRKDIFSLNCFVDRQEAAVELAKRKYFAAPVVDSENHILGIIQAERMIQGVREDVTKDMQRMFGAGGDERVSSTIMFSLKKRLPWLHVNLATAF